MTKKTLDEELAEKAKVKGISKLGAGRAAFIAQKDEIKVTLEKGWSVADVWKLLHEDGRISVTYQAFNVYVNRYIRAAKKSEHDLEGVSTMSVTTTKKDFNFKQHHKEEEIL